MIHQLLLHPGDEPLFSVTLHGSGTPVELRINDVPVFREAVGVAFNVTLPINEWLFQGENELRLESGSRPGSPATVAARLTYRRLRQPLNNSVPLFALQRAGTDDPAALDAADGTAGREETSATPPPLARAGEPADFTWQRQTRLRRAEGGMSLAARFTLPRPWPICPWAEGAVLSEQVNLKYSVRRFIEELWGCLEKRDLVAIMKVAAVRAASLETAYHLNAAEVEEALLFPRLLQIPSWQMAPLRDEEWRLEVAGHGRLARLVEERTGESPLRLVNTGEKLEAVLDAWWAFTHRWILMR